MPRFQALWLLLPFLCLASAEVKADSAKYYAPPAQVNVALQVMDQGFSNVMGLFGTATGLFSFDEAEKTISAFRLAIDSGSLVVANKGAERDLTRLLETANYPEISFAAAAPVQMKDGKAEIKGTLTAHGVSKPFTFEATINNIGQSQQQNSLWGGKAHAVGLSLRGSMKRADFGMGDPPEQPGRFGDALQLMIEVQAIRQ